MEEDIDILPLGDQSAKRKLANSEVSRNWESFSAHFTQEFEWLKEEVDGLRSKCKFRPGSRGTSPDSRGQFIMSKVFKPANNREKTQQTYENALKDVKDGMPLLRAAKQWGIPETTLRDRNNGKHELAGKGKIPYLTVAEEDKLADWLVERSKRGFGLSVSEFLDSVQKFIEKDKRETPFQRNRQAENAIEDKKRAKISAADLDIWFTEYAQFLREHGLVNHPAQIWNCDETGFDLQGKAGKVLGPAAPKSQPYRVVTGTKEHITVLPCFNAAGQWIPPYFLFSGKYVPNTHNLLDGGVPGSAFSMTEKGYMDAATFYMWLANHFIPNLPSPRPVVLLVDSADAHIDLQTFELAKENQVHIFALLKNATHLVQPADVGLFGSMKQTWYKNVRLFSKKHPNTDITKKNFCSVFKSTWDEVMHPSTLSDAFRKSGIYPVCRDQITNDQVRSSLVYSCSDQSTHTPLYQASEVSLPKQKTPVKVKYKRRLDDGYNLDGSPTFTTWKKLNTAASTVQSLPNELEIQEQPLFTSAPWPNATSASSSSVSPVLEEIIIYPTACESSNVKCKNVKRTLPNFLTGETSMKIMLDAKLKKARELAAKQRKLKEREEKKEAKRREQEAKKWEVQEKKEKKKTEKAARKKRNAGARNKCTSNGRKWRRSLPQNNDNNCKVCWQEYSSSDDENLPWVMCDQCQLWMHIDCIPVGVDQTPIDNEEQFFCHDCC
ncbi:uncharacterized protein [Montipora capricornis]|uniref:uncharacterized protein n=1 Tax=Montipora capricornis TaxID=246305 RepID=UPI0035F157B7